MDTANKKGAFHQKVKDARYISMNDFKQSAKQVHENGEEVIIVMAKKPRFRVIPINE